MFERDTFNPETMMYKISAFFPFFDIFANTKTLLMCFA